MDIKTRIIQAIINEMRADCYKEYSLNEYRDILTILEQKLDEQYELLEYFNGEEVILATISIEDADYIFPIKIQLQTQYDIEKMYYELTINYQSDYCGYCMCTEEDEGYNEEHRCCGVECDWEYPTLKIKRVENVAYEEFEGLQKDLWKAEDEFIEKYFGRESLQYEKEEEEIKRMTDMLFYHKRECQKLKEKLDELQNKHNI